MEKYKYFTRRINYYETDKMAVVHHSNYARYLEECRIMMLEHYGISLCMFEEMGYMIPVVELNCKYIESAKYGDTIKIVPKLSEVSPVKFKITYKIYNEDMSRVIHEAYSTHCFIDGNYRPVSMKREHPDLYNKMIEISNL